MQTQEVAERLEADRRHLLYKLDHVGFIPDTDMREKIEAIKAELKERLAALRDNK